MFLMQDCLKNEAVLYFFEKFECLEKQQFPTCKIWVKFKLY